MAHPIDLILRQVTKSDIPKDNSEQKIVFHSKKNEVLSKAPLVGFGNIDYYILAPDRKIKNRNGTSLTWESFRDKHQLDLKITYEVVIPFGADFGKIIRKLREGDSIGETFDNFIKQQCSNYFDNQKRRNINPILDFDKPIVDGRTIRNDLSGYIEEMVYKDFGMRGTFIVELNYTDEFLPIEKDSIEYFDVRVMDYKDPIKLKYEILLEVQDQVRAVLFYRENYLFDEIIKDEIKSHLLKNVTLHQFKFQLDEDAKTNIETSLNHTFQKYGRSVGYLNLKAQESKALDFENIALHESKVSCRVENYDTPIIVENKVSMQLTDIKKFSDAKITDLKAWIEKELNDTIRKVISFKKYHEIVLETAHKDTYSNRYELEIAKQLKVKAKSIGYDIQQLLIDPEIPSLRWLRDITIDVEDEYATKEDGIPIKLGINISGRIQDLHLVKQYLKPDTYLKGKIENATKNITRKFFLKTFSDRAYLEFYESKYDDESVETELIRKLEDFLSKEFALVGLDINIRTIDTPIIFRYKELQKRQGHFQVSVKARNSGRHSFNEEVTFDGKFSIIGISNWSVFKIKKYPIDKAIQLISDDIVAALKEKLRLLPIETLINNEVQSVVNLKEQVNQSCSNEISDAFGLFIKITHFLRKEVASENAMFENSNKAILENQAEMAKMQKKLISRDFQEIDRLLEEEVVLKTKVEMGIEKKSSLTKLQKKINDLRNKLSGTTEDYKKSLPTGSSDTNNVNDVFSNNTKIINKTGDNHE